jgi:hypothetical protein
MTPLLGTPLPAGSAPGALASLAREEQVDLSIRSLLDGGTLLAAPYVLNSVPE